MAALKAGKVDVIQVFEPFPSLLLADKAAHVWYEAARRGVTAYTLLLRPARHPRPRGATNSCAWYAPSPRRRRGSRAHRARRSPRRSRDYFKDVAPAILEAACSRYKTLGIWNATPFLPRESYDRLRDSLVSGGFVSPGTPFETAVDNSLADAV